MQKYVRKKSEAHLHSVQTEEEDTMYMFHNSQASSQGCATNTYHAGWIVFSTHIGTHRKPVTHILHVYMLEINTRPMAHNRGVEVSCLPVQNGMVCSEAMQDRAPRVRQAW